MNNIKKFRLQYGMKQIDLCKKLGITQGALSGWENGKYEPDISALMRLSEIFNTTVDDILGSTQQSSREIIRRKGIRVPVYGQVAAGIPMEAIEDIEDYEELDPDLFPAGEYMALKIHGHSMEPRMMEGDVVIVRLQSEVNTGDTAVVFVGNDDATCKKIKRSPEGITLISTNPAFDPMFFSNKEIESLPIRILGKVVELRAKY